MGASSSSSTSPERTAACDATRVRRRRLRCRLFRRRWSRMRTLLLRRPSTLLSRLSASTGRRRRLATILSATCEASEVFGLFYTLRLSPSPSPPLTDSVESHSLFELDHPLLL